MSYLRGLFRLWLVASVLWVAFVGWLYTSELVAAFQSNPVVTESRCTTPSDPKHFLRLHELEACDALLKPKQTMLPGIASAAFLPPLLVLVVGGMLRLALRGFKG